MSQDTHVLKAISWRDLCPWLLLPRAIGVAFRPAIWMTAFIGLLITPIGWVVSQKLLLVNTEIANYEFKPDEDPVEPKKPIRNKVVTPVFWGDTPGPNTWVDDTPLKTFWSLSNGHVQMLNLQNTTKQCFYFFLGTVWTLGVWSLFGGMICRIATTHFTRDERTGPIEAFVFCKKRFISLMVCASIPLILILCFSIPLWFIGLLLKMDLFVVIAGFGWFMILLIGGIMAILLVPLYVGWPLLWPAIATENADPFDAVSRGFSYPTQRPFHFAFYTIVILLVGFLALWFVNVVGNKSIEFTKWGSSWGAGYERVIEIETAKNMPPKKDSGDENTDSDDQEAYPSMRVFGAKAIKFWEKSLTILIIGFQYGFFFVSATGMYLLLRKDTDNTELDEVYLEEEFDVEPLPTMKSPPEINSPVSVEPPAAEQPTAEPEANESPDSVDDDDDGELREED